MRKEIFAATEDELRQLIDVESKMGWRVIGERVRADGVYSALLKLEWRV